MLALQIMELMKNVFKLEGLELYLYPYRVIATKPGCGVIECVPNSNSRDAIGRKTDIDLYRYFLDKYGDTDSTEYQRARRNFIMSMAGYYSYVKSLTRRIHNFTRIYACRVNWLQTFNCYASYD